MSGSRHCLAVKIATFLHPSLVGANAKDSGKRTMGPGPIVALIAIRRGSRLCTPGISHELETSHAGNRITHRNRVNGSAVIGVSARRAHAC